MVTDKDMDFVYVIKNVKEEQIKKVLKKIQFKWELKIKYWLWIYIWITLSRLGNLIDKGGFKFVFLIKL